MRLKKVRYPNKPYWISLSYATFGVVVDPLSNKVIESAPIGKWMIGKNISDITLWVKNKKGEILEIKGQETR